MFRRIFNGTANQIQRVMGRIRGYPCPFLRLSWAAPQMHEFPVEDVQHDSV
jgi:hypothetical protein